MSGLDLQQQLAVRSLTGRDIRFGVYIATNEALLDVSQDVLQGQFTRSVETDGPSFSFDVVFRPEIAAWVKPNDWVFIAEAYDPEREEYGHERASSGSQMKDRWVFIGMVSEQPKTQETQSQGGVKTFLTISGKGWQKVFTNSMFWVPPTDDKGRTDLAYLQGALLSAGSPRTMLAQLIWAWCGKVGAPSPITLPAMKRGMVTTGRDYPRDGYSISDKIPRPEKLPIPTFSRSVKGVKPDADFFKSICWCWAEDIAGQLFNVPALMQEAYQQPGTTLISLILQFAMTAVNELWFDVRECYDDGQYKPAIMLRQKPFSKADWERLKVHTIWDGEIANAEIGVTDADVVNFAMFNYSASDWRGDLFLGITRDINVTDPFTGEVYTQVPFQDDESIRQNGMRPLIQEIPYFYSEPIPGLEVKFGCTDANGMFENLNAKLQGVLKEEGGADILAVPIEAAKAKYITSEGETGAAAAAKANVQRELQDFMNAGDSEAMRKLGDGVLLAGWSWLTFAWNRWQNYLYSGTIVVPYRFQSPGRRLIVKSQLTSGNEDTEEYYIESVTVAWGRNQPTMAHLGVTRGIVNSKIDRFGNLPRETEAVAGSYANKQGVK